MSRSHAPCQGFAFHPLALAAAALLVGAASPAQAQSFSSTGANSTAPVNYFPIDPFASVLDFTGSTLFVGNSAPGSFSAMAGGVLKADGLSIANGGVGSGTVTVTGIGTRVSLGGTGNRLEIGNWGAGSLVVSAGALVDATVNPAACSSAGASCFNFVGNGAGSTASLTVTGNGSELRAIRGFGVGQVAVFAPPADGFTFGTPGGTTNANVSVLDGGLLRTEAARIGVGAENAAATGTERAFGTVTIDGSGSRWQVGHNSVDKVAAGIAIGTHARGDGTLNVRNGGMLVIDGNAGPGPFDYLNIGVDGGQGRVTVSGLGSGIEVKGNNAIIQVGRSGAGAQGSFSLLAGATASALLMNVGRDGASGSMSIDGTGSVLSLVGVGTTGTAGAAFANIGRDGGSGQVAVSGGGRWLVGDGGSDSRPSNTSPGISVGRGSGGKGALAITGPGSSVEIVSTSMAPAAGVGDNLNPFLALGYDSGSSGQLTIDNGARLVMTGNALSTPENVRNTFLAIGGRLATASGNGTAKVSGSGSEIIVQGVDAFIGIGRGVGVTGTLSVSDGGRVASTNLVVGETGGTGLLALDNGSLALTGHRTGDLNTGAGMTVGRGIGASGTMTLANAARVTITSDQFNGGISIGGDQFVSGGTGVVSLTGGSSIEVRGPVAAGAISVGRSGSGSMSLTGASSVTLGDTRSLLIGRETSGVGKVTLSGNSTLSAGYVGVGSTRGADGAPSTDGGVATLIIDNSSVTAGTLEIGARGRLSGNEGTINGLVIDRGVLSPGDSPGRIVINGGFQTRGVVAPGLRVAAAAVGGGGGELLMDIGSNGAGGYNIDHLVLTKGSSFDFTNAKVTFNFLGTVDPNAFAATGGFDCDNFIQSRSAGVDSGLSSVFKPGTTWSDVLQTATFTAVSANFLVTRLDLASNGSFAVTAVPIPEPGTWALTLAGLVMLWLRRRGVAAGATNGPGARG